MKLLKRICEEKSMNTILLSAGIIMLLLSVFAVLTKSLHNGEQLLPAVTAAAMVDSVTADDGSVYIHGEKFTGAVSGSDMFLPEEADVPFRVNINSASCEELMLIPGIGEKRAEDIIEYRRINGGFRAVSELLEIEGIGEKLYSQISPYCTVEGDPVQYK